jgi:polar amino acid transport system permease protein
VEQFLHTFFSWTDFKASIDDVVRGFMTNLSLMFVAEACVLVWGLVLALVRLSRSRALAPLRWLTIGYIDLFRAIPGLLLIYMIGFGIPIAGVPWIGDWSLFQLAVLALTILYGAYVAEVYRAGIESIHWSQTSAARSLGLSHGKTLRFVVVPQAVKRVTPPLLNDFIGLQKDTALVTVIGTVDAFTQSKTYASNYFNLSSVTVVALLFILITIPQTRFVDRLLDKDRQRQRALG